MCAISKMSSSVNEDGACLGVITNCRFSSGYGKNEKFTNRGCLLTQGMACWA